MPISESDDGRATARTRQNAGKVLNAVKNSGEARRILIGGTNLPESTSCTEMTVVFSNRRPRRAEQDCARDGSGARQQSTSTANFLLFPRKRVLTKERPHQARSIDAAGGATDEPFR